MTGLPLQYKKKFKYNKAFDEVTIMFANTADFKTIIKNSNIDPIQIINFVNSAVFVYDKVVSTYGRVHKVLNQSKIKLIVIILCFK